LTTWTGASSSLAQVCNPVCAGQPPQCCAPVAPPPPILAEECTGSTSDTVHFILPRYKDLDALNSELIGRDLLGPESLERKAMARIYSSISWGKSLGFTVGFNAVMLGLAAWAFTRKDY